MTIFEILLLIVGGGGLLTVLIRSIYNILFVNSSPVKNFQSPKTPCKASWQVKVYGGNLYEVKCRKCGVRVESNGTPICQISQNTANPK